MPTSSAYLFLEVGIIVFFLGFGWEHWRVQELRSRWLWLAAGSLALFWFVIDEIAIRLNLWTFPDSGTLPIRILALPIEEYLLFFVHTLICFVLLRQLSGFDE